MTTKRSFTPALFSFLNDLERHNEREWFNANKARYETVVKDPAFQFVEDFAPYLHKISPHFVADTRPVGGSVFRIYRDTRFSKDKTPYKTNTGVHFRHEMAKDVHAPGFYLHLEPGSCFAGVGIWRPDTTTAGKIRQAIAEEPGTWKRAAHGKRFAAEFSLDGDKLKRPPKGFDPEHPMIEDLKLKDFIGGTQLTQKTATAPGFLDEYYRLCRAGTPLMKFLCGALAIPF